MTLDEAIKHAEEVAKEKERDRDVRKIHLDNRNSHNNIVHYQYQKACECAKEHRQLAEWLKELKRLKEKEFCEDAISRKAAIEAMIKIEQDDINQYGCKILEGFDSDPAVQALNNLPSITP